MMRTNWLGSWQLIFLLLICTFFLSFLQTQKAFAICTNFDVVYVRGSGQVTTAKVGDSGYEFEREALKLKLHGIIGADKYQFTELDHEALNLSGKYEAIKINEENILVGVNAVLSRAQFGKYASSVSGGVSLLNEYFTKQNNKDPTRCYLLIGYSQGAHVIGDFLEASSKANTQILDKIKYIGLLGDPKLDLDGLDVIPGTNVPWYRGTAIPNLQVGLLGGRKPYVPVVNKKILIPTSSWCFNDDVVCSSNFIAVNGTAHHEYPERAIPQMALEVANVINNPSGTIDKNKRPAETCGPAKQDIVIMIDTSPMMRRDATLFTDTPMYSGGSPGQAHPTAGEMLTQVGCGDTRIAVLGYGRAEDGPPRLLLDFTKDSKAYDQLMKSLYQPNTTGKYERTQFREAAIKSLGVSWRPDAGRVIFPITDIAGSGPVGSEGWRGWEDQRVKDPYLKDNLSQTLIQKFRESDAILLGMPITHSYSGFTLEGNDIAQASESQRYLRMMSMQTGGYMWVKQTPNYGTYDFRYMHIDQTINHAIQLREKTIASVPSIRGTVGQPVTLRLNDTISQFAAASLRLESTNYSWYVYCNNLSKVLYDSAQTVTFTPAQSGKCTGAVIPRI